MIKVGIIILTRYSSSRLPGKALKEINDETLLGSIYDRLSRKFENISIIVACSINEKDNSISQFCKRSGIKFYKGPENNVSKRFLKCAEENNFTYAVRINGDNYFADIQTISEAIAIAKTNRYEFITNVPGRTYPYGMSVEVINVEKYRNIVEEIETDADKEHVFSWIYRNPDRVSSYCMTNYDYPKMRELKLAIDTAEDMIMAEEISLQLRQRELDISLKNINQILAEEITDWAWKGKFGPLTIAEIGGNHEGNFEYAKKLCRLAIDSEIDCIKFQIYKSNTLVSSVEDKDRCEHFKRFELTNEQHEYLARMCIDGGKLYNASVWDLESLDIVDKYLQFYKIGSGDMTNYKFIDILLKREKPILLSTGLATLGEVVQTVKYIQSKNSYYKKSGAICVMQCTSMYPIPHNEANLNVLKTYKRSFGYNIGYSDHTIGIEALIQASIIGSKVLEFHFTDSRDGKEFRDHMVSLTPFEIAELNKHLINNQNLSGTFIKRPVQSEIDSGHINSFRRGCYLNRNIKAGDQITTNDLETLRPLIGTDARDYSELIGKKAKVDIYANNRIIEGLQY